MDPKSGYGNSDGTVGDVDSNSLPQKCSRRVRFAETTAVYVFDRDENLETPSDSDLDQDEESFSSLMKFSNGNEDEEEESGFQPEYYDSDEDDDDVDGKFSSDMDSCWTGSVAVSLTSNDEDDFFGPVSTNFTQSDHLSDQDEMIHSIGLAKDGKNNTLLPPRRRPLNDFVSQSDQGLQKSVQGQPQVPCSLVDVQQHLLSENGIQTPQNALQAPQSPLLGSVIPVHLSQLDTKRNNGCFSFNSYSERANEHKECSQTDDATTDTKASHIKMLGSKLYSSEGGCVSPKVNGTASQNNPSNRQSLKNMESNDGFVCKNKEQINESIDFQSEVGGENIQTNKRVDKISTDNHFLKHTSELHAAVNMSTQLAEKTVRSFSTVSSNGEIMQHSLSVQNPAGKKRGIDQMLPAVKDNINEESRIQKIPRIF